MKAAKMILVVANAGCDGLTGLYLTLPAMALAGALFLAAARWQPADHQVRATSWIPPEYCALWPPVSRSNCALGQAMVDVMAQSRSGGEGVRDPMLQQVSLCSVLALRPAVQKIVR